MTLFRYYDISTTARRLLPSLMGGAWGWVFYKSFFSRLVMLT